jgi:tRNA pseudouridine55 synthase
MEKSNQSPQIYCLHKPENITSYDVIRKLKRRLPKKIKIGHFGTLDPFASGLLLVGAFGAARLNEDIHSMKKTYVATGILGVKTVTGDLTVEPSQTDDGPHFKEVISKFDIEFIQKQLNELVGEYWQAPPAYSAAKFQGKALHKWAREGVEIKKEKKQRFVYRLKVLEYDFPKLKIEVEVSSGTYIRTLFEDAAQILGTLGTLEKLERTQIGPIKLEHATDIEDLEEKDLVSINPQQVLKYPSIELDKDLARRFVNGAPLRLEHSDADRIWVTHGELCLGLGKLAAGHLSVHLVFSYASKNLS